MLFYCVSSDHAFRATMSSTPNHIQSCQIGLTTRLPMIVPMSLRRTSVPCSAVLSWGHIVPAEPAIPGYGDPPPLPPPPHTGFGAPDSLLMRRFTGIERSGICSIAGGTLAIWPSNRSPQR